MIGKYQLLKQIKNRRTNNGVAPDPNTLAAVSFSAQ